MKQSDFFIKSCLAFFQITVLATFYIYSAYLANADEHTVGAALKLKMKYLAQNQAVISKNLANANTPGYKAIELKEPQYNVGKAQGIGLATTSPMHINGRGGIGGSFKAVKQKDTYETAPNGNNVSVEEQMVKMSSNNMDHQTTTSLIKKMGNLMNIARGEK